MINILEQCENERQHERGQNDCYFSTFDIANDIV